MRPNEIVELKVYPAGGQLIVHVPNGRGEELRLHLESHGVRALVSPAAVASFERLEIAGDEDAGAVQAILDEWER
jgi:hypothetical protein